MSLPEALDLSLLVELDHFGCVAWELTDQIMWHDCFWFLFLCDDDLVLNGGALSLATVIRIFLALELGELIVGALESCIEDALLSGFSDAGDGLVDKEGKVLDGLGIELDVLLELLNLVLEVLQVLASSLFNVLVEKSLLDVALIWSGLQVLKSLLIVLLVGILSKLIKIVVKCHLELGDPMVQSRVPVVFNGVVRATIQVVDKLSPFVGRPSLEDEEDPLLSIAPPESLQGWVQLIVPSLTALLTSSVIQLLCNTVPLLWSMDLHQLDKSLILLSIPRTFLSPQVFEVVSINKLIGLSVVVDLLLLLDVGWDLQDLWSLVVGLCGHVFVDWNLQLLNFTKTVL